MSEHPCKTAVGSRVLHADDDIANLVNSMRMSAFQARALGEAAAVLREMAQDKDCFRVLTLAGAIIPAGLGPIIAALIRADFLDAIVCTGAAVSHDIVNAVGGNHYRYEPKSGEFDDIDGDKELRDKWVNRVYDTLVTEADYEKAQKWMAPIFEELASEENSEEEAHIPSYVLTQRLGLDVDYTAKSFIKAAANHDVPVFVPAFYDSEIGLNLVLENDRMRGRLYINGEGDVRYFANLMMRKRHAGILIIGGGVPRNWAQQIFPYLEAKGIYQDQGHSNDILCEKGYRYGVRITTDRPEYGGMSGCTMNESVTWGKYVPEARQATVICDATIALPLLIPHVLGKRLSKDLPPVKEPPVGFAEE